MFFHTLFVAIVYLLGSIILLFIAWYFYIRTSSYYRTVNRIPGPKFYLPILGNAMDLSGGLDHVLTMFQEKWPQTYGDIYRIFIGNHCYVALSSPEFLETIFNSQKIIDKGVSYRHLLPWLGQGLLTSTGDYWRTHRKMLTPAFHFKILDSFVDVFNQQSRVLISIMGEVCDSFPEKKGEIDVYPMLTRCSLDVICEAAMGTKINAQREDSDYVKAVYRMAQVIMAQSQRPWLWNHTVFSYSSLGREHASLLKILHSFTDGVINNRREELKKFGKSGEDLIQDETETGIKKQLALLDLLLKVSDDGRVLTHQEIRQEIDTFMFEGHDTTTSLMSWFLYSMASNPDCQEKAWMELQNVFEDSDRDCTQEDIPHLKYLERCIKETLRIYPSVPGFERETLEEVQIGNYIIPAGCTVGCMTMATHRNPKIFPDPLTFNPDRFLPSETIGRHPYAYYPFSAGPRNCIGQRFAMLETKILLSSLLRRFKFEISPGCKVPIPSAQLILKSLTGINLVISHRRQVD